MTVYEIGPAVPTKLVTGVNVTLPSETSTSHVPLLASVTDVCEQFGAVSLDEQIFTLVTSSPVPVSLVSGVTTMSPSLLPVAVSALALGAVGELTVAVICALNSWPTMSVAAYEIVEVPAKFASGTNVTTPVDVLSVHVPLPDTVTLVDSQFGAVSLAAQSLSRDADVPDATSLLSGVIVNVTPTAPLALSATGAGVAGELTVTLIVALEHDDAGVLGAHVPETVLHT